MNWQTFDLNIPDIASATDEELEALFPELDGRWSRQTHALIKAHGATGLDLDQNWAGVPQWWACPCCLRAKVELVRMNTNGVLMAHLHEHHDHIHEYMAHRLQARYGKEWPRGIPPGTYELEHSGSVMIERFQRTLVCEECNTADAEAKSRSSRIDSYFSFRPSEIASFIKPHPNRKHDVDANQAQEIWETERSEFQQRIALADHLLDHIHQGAITRERTRGVPGWPFSYDAMAHQALVRAEGAYEAIGVARDALINRSIARDGVGASRPRTDKAGPRPTPEEVAAHDGGQYPANWLLAGPDWRCAACDRDRADILRRSRKSGRRWSGDIRPHTTYLYGPCPTSCQADAVVVAHESRFICDCCASLLGWLRSQEPGAAPSALGLTLEDMRLCSDAGPNRQHIPDLERLRTAAAAAEKVAPSITAYHGRLAVATAPRQTYHYFLGRKPGDWAFAWREVVGRYGRMPQGEILDAARDRIRTLTSLADRLAPLDSGPTPLPSPQGSPSAEAIRAFSADVLPRINWG